MWILESLRSFNTISFEVMNIIKKIDSKLKSIKYLIIGDIEALVI